MAQLAYANPVPNANRKQIVNARPRVNPGWPSRNFRVNGNAMTIDYTRSPSLGIPRFNRTSFLTSALRSEFRVSANTLYFCAMRSHALLEDLAWRGLLYQHTEEVGDLLNSGPISGYIG